MLGLPPSTVILPESMAKPTQNLLDAYGALDGSTLPCSIVPLAPGMVFRLTDGHVLSADIAACRTLKAHYAVHGDACWTVMLLRILSIVPVLSCSSIRESGTDIDVVQDRSTSYRVITL